MAAAARTIDGSGVDRIGQQSNEVSSDELLNVGCRLQLHQAGEFAVGADGLRAHRDGADRAGRFGYGISVISTEPISSRRPGALRDRDITNQPGEHGGAEFSDGKTITQRLNEIAGEQVGGDQVASSRSGAFDVITLAPAVIRDKETLGAPAVGVLQLLVDLTLKASL